MIRVIDLILGMPKRAARESGEKETDPQQYFIKWIIWAGGGINSCVQMLSVLIDK